MLLVLVQAIMHLPEPTLRRCRLGCFGGLRSMRVGVAQREVPEDRSELVAEDALDLLHDRVGGAAVRALVVAVLDQRQRRRLGTAAGMVARADRNREAGAVQLLAHAGLGSEIASSALKIPSAPGLISLGET